MTTKKRRLTDQEKHDVVRRYVAAGGAGSTMRRLAICTEAGVQQATICRWKREGFGANVPTIDLQLKNGQAEDAADVVDWLIAAGEALSLPDDVMDRLLAHRCRWERREA